MAAYGTELGLNYETSLKIGNAFGGGMGRTGETCGAVTGALMIISLKYGAVHGDDKESKGRTYNLAGRFLEAFRAYNKTVLCRELIGFNLNANDKPQDEKTKIIMEKCPAYIKDAAEIIEQIIN